jgi:nucleoside-diphosphate-sugar epimerase
LKNVSLFGGTGFVGAQFARLSANTIDVVDRNNPNPIYPDVVYAIGTTDNYNIFEDPYLDIQTNLIKLISDLELLRNKFGKFTFNYLSSWFVYGEGAKLPFEESQACNPKGFYSISKFSAEMFLTSYAQTFGIDYRILRLANVYGSSDSSVSKKKNALQYLISQIKSGAPVDLYEGGDFQRDYIDVRDVSAAIDLVIEKGVINSIINIGTGMPSRFLDLMQEAKRVFDSPSELNSILTPDFHKNVQVRDAFMDVERLRTLGFVPKYRVIDEIVNL